MKNLTTRSVTVDLQKIVDALPGFEEVGQGLEGFARHRCLLAAAA